MSNTTFSSIATCTVEGFADTESVALAVYDYLVNHPDEIPNGLDDDDDVLLTIKSYLNLDGNQLTIEHDSDDVVNYDSEVFDFLTRHFAMLQSSSFMKVNWKVDDSRDGMSSGTDYYGKDGVRIDVDSIKDLSNYMLIDISTGTVLTAEHCRLVHNNQITESEWNRFDEMSDEESMRIGRERGQRIALDDQLAESIADALWGDGADTEWGPDTLNTIADAIRELRPDLAGEN